MTMWRSSIYRPERYAMTENPRDLTEVEPLTITDRADKTDGEFVRWEALVHPSPGGSATETDLPHRRYLLDNPDEHIHPVQEEYVTVLSGEYRVAIDGIEQTLAEGDDITIPADTRHRHWNPSNYPAYVAHETRPALHADILIESLYTLAQAGKTDEKGVPDPLQFAVIMDAFPDHAYTTDLPIWVQKTVFKLLAPLGRLAGYKAAYSRDEIETLR